MVRPACCGPWSVVPGGNPFLPPVPPKEHCSLLSPYQQNMCSRQRRHVTPSHNSHNWTAVRNRSRHFLEFYAKHHQWVRVRFGLYVGSTLVCSTRLVDGVYSVIFLFFILLATTTVALPALRTKNNTLMGPSPQGSCFRNVFALTLR